MQISNSCKDHFLAENKTKIDLKAQLNIKDHDDVIDAYRKVIEACVSNGKYPGMGGVYSPPVMRRYVDMGARLILAGNDLSFMMAGASHQANEVRAMLG